MAVKGIKNGHVIWYWVWYYHGFKNIFTFDHTYCADSSILYYLFFGICGEVVRSSSTISTSSISLFSCPALGTSKARWLVTKGMCLQHFDEKSWIKSYKPVVFSLCVVVKLTKPVKTKTNLSSHKLFLILFDWLKSSHQTVGNITSLRSAN